jgi:small subunit ribosomal protein S2
MAKKIEDLLAINAHVGHTRQNYNPKSKEFIAARVDRVDYIDITKLSDCVSTMHEFVSKVFSEGGNILMVGTKKQCRSLIQKAATEVNSPYVNNRWIGGTLTNFVTIRSIVNQYERLIARQKTGALEKLPRKEYLLNLKDLERLKRRFDGLRKLKEPPRALFVIDTVYEENAIREASLLGIPIIATIDSNSDPEMVDYPLPINDDSRASVEYIISEFVSAAKDGITKLSRAKSQVTKN